LAFPVHHTSSPFCLPSSLILLIFGHGDGDAQIFLAPGRPGLFSAWTPRRRLKTLNQGDGYYGI
jgi:hypothetical protein